MIYSSQKRYGLIILSALCLCLLSGTNIISAQESMESCMPKEGMGAQMQTTSRMERLIASHTSGTSIGYHPGHDEKIIWDENVSVDVSGVGRGERGPHNNVTGIYLLDGAQLTIGGDLRLRLTNARPPVDGATPGTDVAHYHMSGIYAGYGGQVRGRTHGTTQFLLRGNLDMEVTGVGLQANKDSMITVGGGRIVTQALTSSDTYALLAEEGTVSMNVAETNALQDAKAVHIIGNLGVLNKNYGIDPNPNRRTSLIALSLPTADSTLTGGILNEFEENGSNPQGSGVDLRLSNHACWRNKWLGAPREKAARPNAASYLYTGSKIRNLCGAASREMQASIIQEESLPITINNFSGHIRVIYTCKADGCIMGGGIIIRHAARNSSITLFLDTQGYEPADIAARKDTLLHALAGKLHDTNASISAHHLTVYVEMGSLA